MSTELGTRMPDGGLQQMLSVDGGEMRALCMPIINAMNAQMAAGVSVDMMLMGSLYAVGLALAHRGVVIDMATIPASIEPLATGYSAMRRDMEESANAAR